MDIDPQQFIIVGEYDLETITLQPSGFKRIVNSVVGFGWPATHYDSLRHCYRWLFGYTLSLQAHVGFWVFERARPILAQEAAIEKSVKAGAYTAALLVTSQCRVDQILNVLIIAVVCPLLGEMNTVLRRSEMILGESC